jgi:hypothetical protein
MFQSLRVPAGESVVNIRWKIGLALGVVFALAQTLPALACACCTNTGQRYVENTKLDSYRMNVVQELRFEKKVRLFTGEADLENIKGITNPTSRDYALSVTQQKGRFVFSFRDGKKNEGTLTLALPDAIAIFEVDTRDEPYKDQGLGPVLYKEWRLTAPFAGTGIFKAGNGGYQRITLIFQGRGRGCTDTTHFSHWTISVHGPLGNYQFFGDLTKP